MGQPQKEFPSKAALALAEALKRDRAKPPSHPRATIEDICKALGAERIYSNKDNAKPGVTMFINRPQD